MIFYMQVINIYDWIISTLEGIWKHGLSPAAFGVAVFALLKTKAVKKKVRRLLPWALDSDSEVKEYIHNQHLIMEALNIKWNRGVGLNEPYTATSSMKSSISSQGEKSMKFKNKWKSRRFLLTVFGAALIIINEFFDLSLSPESQATIVGILVSFIVGESVVDAKRASKGEQNEKYPTADDAE